MTIFTGLILLVAMCGMTGSCLAVQEDLCKSFTDEGAISNGSNNASVKLVIQHSFLDVEKGVVPGLQFNVSLEKPKEDEVMYFALNTEPLSAFENLPSEVSACNEQHQIVVGLLTQDITFSFTPTKFLNTTLLFFLSTRNTKAKQWSTSVQGFPVRSDCHYVNPTEDLVLSSEDVAVETSKSIMIRAPESSGLEIILENLLLPADSTMLIYNITETSVALILSSADEDQKSFLTLENHFLLIDVTRCFDCRFRALIKPIATSYKCNSTLRIARGYLELMKLKPPRVCNLIFEAPLFHRVLMKIVNMRASRTLSTGESCNPRMLILGPLAGVPKEKSWSACDGLSQAQTEFYISDNNIFNVKWDSSVDGVRLKYEFFPLCANRTLGETSSGHFCSPGYPDIFFGCNTSYSINVPLGYSIELQLSVLGGTAGALCQNNSLQVTSQNASHGEKLLLSVCLDAADGQRDQFNLRTSSNRVDIRIQPKGDMPRKGFCGTYKAIPSDPNLVADCPYSWVSGPKFCYKIFEQKLPWMEAEEKCKAKGGHLASITDNRISFLIDDIIKNSIVHEKNHAFWIGANDLRYENCYEWTDGQPFDFYYWFPGWENYGWYSVQPSDDGLSQQNCVELRNLFRYPSKGEGITERYFWNDRDCQVSNPFVCQRLKPGVSLEPVSTPQCNKTIVLSWEHPKDILTSPSFPNNYPNNLKCHYHISTTQGKRIVAFFTDFVLEESESCEYDMVILKEEDVKWRRCGDWENKIKLLRYITQGNSFDMVFITDFSHSFKGFRVELSLLTEQSSQSALCDNDMFQLKGNDCYLVVNYPETSWTTARQICSEARSSLAVVENRQQVTILDDLVRSTFGYMSGIIYWVGAYATAGNSTWKWVDGTSLNPDDLRIAKTEESLNPSCLAIQWKQLKNSNALRWIAKNCNHPGRFICRKPSVIVPEELNKTVSQMKGNLSSVNYPSNYLNDLDYIAEIIGPPNSRVVVTFHHFDLEWQEDCLYDFVLLRNDLTDEGVKFCGEHNSEREFVSKVNKAYVSFHSDFSITATGYTASWEIVDLSVCLNRRLLILEPTHITSLRYPRSYLNGLECRVTVIASAAIQRLLLTIVDFDLGHCTDAFLEVNLDPSENSKKIRLCGSDLLPGTQLMAYGNEAHLFFHSNDVDTSAGSPGNRGYNVTCQTWSDSNLESSVYLNAKRKGRIYSLNFNHQQPIGLNYSQRIIAPVGYKIHLRAPNMSQPLSRFPTTCDGSGLVVNDNYAVQKTLIFWSPCRTTNLDDSDGFWSTLHVLSIYGWNFDGTLPSFFFDYAVVKDDHFVNTTLALASDLVESCRPSPCQNGGRCIKNGTHYRCHCYGQYTGLFCHLTWCDVNVCGTNGVCNLTANGWTCDCLPGFTGPRCQQTVTPCSPNPCEQNGVCMVRNSSFACICAPDYEGTYCERFALRIPYKPLSQRMLEEPFWLGLITVFSVLLIILFVYCIKRKFADKIEKFLAEEIERSKYQPSPPATRYSLSSTQPSLTPGNQSPQTNPKSLFNRIRKNSLLSSTCSPSPTADREQSRTFSFDDILRRVHSSKRNKAPANNPSSSGASTSTAQDTTKEDAAKKEEEKSRILASLVNPNKDAASRRMSLDEFFRMSERKLQLSARRTNSTAADSSDTDGKKETSFISTPSPKTLRQSFSEIHSIQEQSIEYMSSSESLNCEPSTSEVKADVSPTPYDNSDSKSIDNDSLTKSPESPAVSVHSRNPSPTPTEQSVPPSVSIVIDQCDSETAKNDSDSEEKNCDSEPKENCENFKPLSPAISRKSSYLEVPQPIPAIHVFSAESDESQTTCESKNCSPKLERSEHSSPCKKDFVQPRKYSIDLPMPKILITANMNSCDSDEASPPRTPNPNKSMMYLSPLAVISSTTDRTISESNLSTSGYSSISSPGLSRCNSSSPISDDVEHQHHPNCSRKTDLQSPKKPHGLQMTYLSVGGNDKAFFFPPTIACHCHTPNQPTPVVFEQKTAAAIPTVWPPGKHRLLYKRNSYQTTSTDDSIDDEGIGMDTIDFKIRKGEVRSARDLEMFIASEKTTGIQVPSSPLLIESNSRPDLLTCSVNKQPINGSTFKGSPRTGLRKGDKPKKHGDKHRRSPVISPASTPVKDHSDNAESRIPRNSSRTSIAVSLVSSSESDEPEGYLGTRQKNQNRRSKKQHEVVASGHKAPPLASMPSQESSGHRTDKSSDATGRSSPLSESNGDSAPQDSRSPASSSSESLPSTRGSTLSEKAFCNRHKFTLEHARSFPPPTHCKDDDKGVIPKSELKRTLKPPVVQLEADDENNRSAEEHPCLRRQEAVVEDDASDDSSSETTVLLRRPPESPRLLHASSSAEVSEWEAFNKE